MQIKEPVSGFTHLACVIIRSWPSILIYIAGTGHPRHFLQRFRGKPHPLYRERPVPSPAPLPGRD